MAPINKLQTNFVAGEIDPLLLGRSDIKHYYNAAERFRNAIPLPEGGGRRRPGTKYLAVIPDIPSGDGGGQSNVRMCNFQFNTEQTYLLVFSHLTLQIYRNQVLQATVTTPYTSADLLATETAEGDLIASGIYWTQSKDTMIIFHQSHPIQRLQRDGSHTAWVLSALALENIPRYDFGDTYTGDEAGVDEVQEIEFPHPGSQGDWTENDTFSLIVEAEESSNIRYLSDATAMAASLQAELRAMDNTSSDGITVTLLDLDGTAHTGGFTSQTKFVVTFAGDDGSREWGQIYSRVISSEQVPSIDIYVETKGRYPGEDVWSATQGYPRCGVFFQGRLWVASSPSLPHWVWASRPGSEVDFNSKLFKEDYGIAVPADTDDVPAFTACHVGRHLQFFSRSGEYYIPVSDTQEVTPGNIALRRTTSRGVKPGLRVFDVDGATHFIQRRGRALREFIFTDVEQAYQANNISLLSPHLMRDPVDFALRRSTSTTDADYEFMPNDDGTLTLFCTLRTQEVNAMTLWKTAGTYKAVAVVLDEVYFAISRTINGVTQLFLETQEDTFTVDCAVSGGSGATGTAAHLPSTEVDVLLDGSLQPALTLDGSGVATFARSAATSHVIGLKYPAPDDDYPNLTWLIKTLPIEMELASGSTVGKKRRIVNLSLRLHETSALQLNNNVISFKAFGSSLLDQSITSFTGTKNIRGLLGWDYDGSVVLGSNQSLPATILSLSFGVSI